MVRPRRVGRVGDFYGNEPWWDEENECWHCARGSITDTIDDNFPASKELEGLTAAQGPVGVVLGLRHED